ncbi:MAG: CPBP family intramembrane metalloprotease [Fimbriimonadaceae bacterium]|nr:CPBP family intramembrane metalloprotease [Fimbriimonadaceae bacterium]
MLESERRNVWTWFLLGGIFLVLIGGSLYGYFSPQHEKVVADSGNDILQLKLMVAMRSGLDMLAESADPASRESIKRSTEANVGQIRKSIREAAAKIADAKSMSTEDARVLLALNQEAGDEPDPRAIDTLKSSKDVTDRNVAQIYLAKTLDPATAESLSPKGDTFLEKLERAHAKEKAGTPNSRGGLLNLGALLALGLGIFVAMGALAVGCLVLVFHFVAVRAGARPKGLPVAHMSKATGDRFALRMSLYLGGFIGISVLVRALPSGVEPVFSQVGALALVAGFVVLMLRTPLFGARDPLSVVAGKKPRQGILRPALAGWAANAPVLFVMVMVAGVLMRFLPTPTHPVQQEIASTSDPLRLAMIFVTASLLAPFIEETTFRGLLFPSLTSLTGKPWVGMVLSGLLFAAIHPQGPALWPALAGLGILMAYLTYWTGSIVPGMVFHGLHNGLTLAFSVILANL